MNVGPFFVARLMVDGLISLSLSLPSRVARTRQAPTYTDCLVVRRAKPLATLTLKLTSQRVCGSGGSGGSGGGSG